MTSITHCNTHLTKDDVISFGNSSHKVKNIWNKIIACREEGDIQRKF
jgi:hypothetical protein